MSRLKPDLAPPSKPSKTKLLPGPASFLSPRVFAVIGAVALVGIIIVKFSLASSTQAGLTAQYFTNETLSGTPLVTRVDPQVNFNWGTSSPARGVPATDFSVRWTGELAAPQTGVYQIITASDDGVRVWIGSQLIVNSWTNHGSMENSGSISLVAGTKYPVKVEFYQHQNQALVSLQWASKAAGITQTVIPQSDFTTTVQSSPTPTPSATPTTSATPVPTPTPTPTPTPASSPMVVGLNGSTWDAAGMSGAVKYVRADSGGATSASNVSSNGMKIDMLFSGPYNSNGVIGLGDPTTWANNALSYYKSHGCTPVVCPMVEVLNEPGGHWFWGSNAMSTANAAAYAKLLRAAYNTFATAYGASRPLILASYDGGQSSSLTWGQEVWAADPSIGNYVDGVTVHPYGGPTDPTSSALGYRPDVTAAHSQTGKNVYVTEVGWPTNCTSSCPTTTGATGDSLQWSRAQQCNNIYNFVTWARSLGYVKAVMIYAYSDDPPNNSYYGVVDGNGAQKPGYSGLRAAAQGLANPCP